MSYLDGREEYYELEEELRRLPKGIVVYKNISGRTYPYLQWHEGGKTRSRYLKASAVEEVRSQLNRREQVEARLAELENSLPSVTLGSEDYRMMVLTDDELLSFARAADEFGHRSCFSRLKSFLAAHDRHRVMVMYGLRRTGKTTLIQQAILAMSKQERSHTAFIESLPGNTMNDLAKDLRLLRRRGYQTVFVDEVTLLSDFIDSSAMLADVFAAMGMSIVLSGTDSLGFWIASGNALYDRSASIHTTFIPFAEWSELLNLHDVDEYIAYGGTLVMGVENFDERGVSKLRSPFLDENSTRRYIDTAIAHNIQHSLEHYRDGGRFGSLYPLYERNELTNVINRVIEDMNHRFALRVIERTFVSGDPHSSMQLLRDAANPHERIMLADYLDEDEVTQRLRHILDILNPGERELGIGPEELEDIEDYLLDLELIERVGVTTLVPKGRRRERSTIVFVQPGMRFCQAKALVHSLRLDTEFQELPEDVKSVVEGKILDDVRGRMLEDIVLLETKRARRGIRKVFKLLVEGDPDVGIRGGEYDMAEFDEATNTVCLFEIKHSDKMVPAQAQHLTDIKKLALVERIIGKVVRRVVLYRGPNEISDSIEYQNVEDYLRGLEAART